MDYETFSKIQERRMHVDENGWYEPCVGEICALDERTKHSLRQPFSTEFKLGAPIGNSTIRPCEFIVMREGKKKNEPDGKKKSEPDGKKKSEPDGKKEPGRKLLDVHATHVQSIDDRLHLYKPDDRTSALHVLRWRVDACGRELIVTFGKFPSSRAELKQRAMANQSCKSLLRKTWVYPNEQSREWFANFLAANEFTDDERKLAFKTARCTATMRLPLHAVCEQTAWHVQLQQRTLDEMDALPSFESVALFAVRATKSPALGDGVASLHSIHRVGTTITAHASDGSTITWSVEKATSPTRFFHDADATSKDASVAPDVYVENVLRRRAVSKLATHFSVMDNVYLSSLAKHDACHRVFAESQVVVGRYGQTGGGYVYTTDAGLRIGVPHVHCDARFGDLSHTVDEPQKTNVFARAAIATCFGRSLRNVDGRLTPHDDETGEGGDGGVRSALLALLHNLRELGATEANRPTVFVIHARNVIRRAQIMGVLNAFPLVHDAQSLPEHERLVSRGSRLTWRDGPFVVNDQTNTVRALSWRRDTCPLPATASTPVKYTYRLRNKRYVHAIPLHPQKQMRVPDEFASWPEIPITFDGMHGTIDNAFVVDDDRADLLRRQPIVFRSTEPVEHCPMIRPFPSTAEIDRLLDFVWHRFDLLFEAD